MIELTHIQTDILYNLVKNRELTLGKYHGLTVAGLGRSGVNRRSVQKNIPFLVSNYLIEHIETENRGKQKRPYFDCTLLGFLVLYQKIILCDLRRYFLEYDDFERYLPAISKNWEKLAIIYENDREGFDVEYFFDNTITHIQIESEDPKPLSNSIHFQMVKLRFNIDQGYYDVSIKSEFEFKQRFFKFPRKFPVTSIFDDRNVFLKVMGERVTFLFFFNMFDRIASYESGKGVVTLPLFDEFLEDSVEGRKLEKNYGVIIRELLHLINDDTELSRIFGNSVKLTLDAISKKQLVKFLLENTHNTLLVG